MYEAVFLGVSIPQAVWIACNKYLGICYHEIMKFQYRKRYGLHAIVAASCDRHWIKRFNTASGMDCMQLSDKSASVCIMKVSKPQAVWIACNKMKTLNQTVSSRFNTASGMDCMQWTREIIHVHSCISFNTASGMDCMQCEYLPRGYPRRHVSIPQAVWIACNI